jgi:hypothetical protein
MEFLATLLANVFTIIGVLLAALTWERLRFRPRFVVGMLPSKTESEEKKLDIGKHLLLDEIVFDGRYFAKVVSAKQTTLTNTDKNELAVDEQRCRHFVASHDEVEFHIVVQNIGGRAADSFNLTISFLEADIRLRSIQPESFDIDALYVHQPEELRDASLHAFVAPVTVISKYEELGLKGDYYELGGSLPSKAFELIYLRVHLPERCFRFHVAFGIDSPQLFDRRLKFVQCALVSKPNE